MTFKAIFVIFILGFIIGNNPEDKTVLSNAEGSTMILSRKGSSRATAYIDSNKIIETEEYVFITYLIYKDGKHFIALKSFSKENKTWSTEVILDKVKDNHGGGSLVIDSQGYLHIAYGPHVGPFVYRKSVNPNDIEYFGDPMFVGNNMTYPSLAIDNNDKIYLLGRHTIIKGKWSLRLFNKNAEDKNWSSGKDILYSNYANWPDIKDIKKGDPKYLYVKNGYSRWNKSIVIDKLNNLHITFKNYEYLPRNEKYSFTNSGNGGSYLIGYLKSEDGGITWKNKDKLITTPAYPSEIEIIDGNSDPKKVECNYGISNLILDKHNTPHVAFSKEFDSTSTFYLAYKKGDIWERKLINHDKTNQSFMYSPSSISYFDNHFYIVATAINKSNYDRQELWGKEQRHSFIQIFKLNSRYKIVKVFSSQDLMVSNPSWLPSLGRGNEYPPKLLFTQGDSKSNSTVVHYTDLN
ncbi:BNR-4 repeat-containing protein [Maribacter stanieri]|uniref:BNR-4 repeat-containing protein n=1 Tax=Maribacter stanieri TaxID=440514 RepID=UPI0024947CAE|nr:BNR-4 repeat-containing protein [Maribacter stanieri]